jgi:predicted RND superfamily exporter protein
VKHSSIIQEVVPTLDEFDPHSGVLLERIIFNNRAIFIAICAIITLALGFQATKLVLNASFEDMIPSKHPYIVNYYDHQKELAGLGNSVRIAVEPESGDIYQKDYMQTLQRINDEVFLIPGVFRQGMKSLWSPTARWVGVTEEGLEGGPIIPTTYNGSPESLRQMERNIQRSGEIGLIVALDGKSSVVHVPLLSYDPRTGEALDYSNLSKTLDAVRDKYQHEHVRIHITGFAKIVGDLIDGLREILLFFGVAVIFAAAMVFWYTRCVRSTLLVVFCSLVAVTWQLGILPTLGFRLDPRSSCLSSSSPSA